MLIIMVNNNMSNQVLRTAFENIDNPNLLLAEHYSYFRQGVNLGADYRVNKMRAFNVGYSWKGVSRTDGQGNTSSHSPQVGVKLTPTDWLSLLTNYTLTTRKGYNNVASEGDGGRGDSADLQIMREASSGTTSISSQKCIPWIGHHLIEFLDL